MVTYEFLASSKCENSAGKLWTHAAHESQIIILSALTDYFQNWNHNFSQVRKWLVWVFIDNYGCYYYFSPIYCKTFAPTVASHYLLIISISHGLNKPKFPHLWYFNKKYSVKKFPQKQAADSESKQVFTKSSLHC